MVQCGPASAGCNKGVEFSVKNTSLILLLALLLTSLRGVTKLSDCRGNQLLT